jgi:hypothetical protein
MAAPGSAKKLVRQKDGSAKNGATEKMSGRSRAFSASRLGLAMCH